jgi:hypothetical protein
MSSDQISLEGTPEPSVDARLEEPAMAASIPTHPIVVSLIHRSARPLTIGLQAAAHQ